jgi:hypothetical protein
MGIALLAESQGADAPVDVGIPIYHLICTNRHSISQTASDEIAIARRGDYVPGVCVIVKPCAFGAPLRGCGT